MVTEQQYTREDIIRLIDTHEEMVKRCLVILYQRQTEDERQIEGTKYQNGQGFNARDASFGTSLAKQHLEGRMLSRKQLAAARKMLKTYVGQLTEACNAGERAERPAERMRQPEPPRVLEEPPKWEPTKEDLFGF